MRRLSHWASRFLVLPVALLALGLCVVPTGDRPGSGLQADALAADGPVASIAPLPDYVSNGTLWLLDGRGSVGVIVNYTWNVTVGGVTTVEFAQSIMYMFKTLGLYKITLTVIDNESRSDSAFTAVVSVLDSDQDTLPDWWEEKYFGDLSQTAEGDFDRDGYDNLEEYARGTNPTVKDSRPTLGEMIKEHWVTVVLAAAIMFVAVLALIPFVRKRQKEREKKKIEAAIAIEKALEEETK
jgi:hypothetical protein